MSNVWINLRPFGFLLLMVLLITGLSRAALVSLWYSRVENSDALSFVLMQGLRFDLVLLGMLLAPVVVLIPLLASSSYTFASWKQFLAIYVALIIMIVAFMEMATPSFAQQFDARPNVLFFEYIGHPKELLGTLWGAYRIQIVAGIPIVALVGFAMHRIVISLLRPASPLPLAVAIPLSVLLLFASVAFARSTLDHRPVNPSTVARTNDSLVNDLALNSTYSVAYAAYELRHEEDGGARYGNMSDENALSIVRREMHVPDSDFMDSTSTWHRTSPAKAATDQPARAPLNLVIILEESLGAEFVGSLGGLNLTPTIDALREEGLSFDKLYATGTRSVRGIEAVTTGFLPTPSRSVVKLSKSQRNFFTLGSVLKEHGYDTSFIYGGEAHFDNMRRFFINNGFDTIVDEKDYENPVFTGSWGVSDEDLFAKAHETFESHGDKPFFSLVFSSSNHTPFEFPDGRIELFDKEKQTVNNAVKYADYALGEFFKKARQSSYWDNTVFLVVADHNSRVYGAELVPVNRFHIPAVVVGAGIEPHHYEKVASQVDLPPTLLSLIGLQAETPMPGRDLTQLPDDVPGRAIMQFNDIQAYMEDDRVIVMQKGVPSQEFRFDGIHLRDARKPDARLSDIATAHASWASATYENGQYKVETRLAARH